MKGLKINNLSFKYRDKFVFKDISFEMTTNSVLGILGKSGCGKTTLLKCIAGFIPPLYGDISFEDIDITQQNPQNRGIVFLTQEALLFPHLNVEQNLAFGLKIKKINTIEIKNRVLEMLSELGLEDMGKRWPHELSGGQKQRVAFGRALIIEPKVLLLDEPFGNLDVETRSTMQTLFLKLQKLHQFTSIFVTHDLKEAIIVGDELAYMSQSSLYRYKDKSKFLNDPVTGVLNEMHFWNSLETKN